MRGILIILMMLCMSVYGQVSVFYARRGWECGDNIVDSRDSKTYQTIRIGTQCWLRQNMNYETGTSACYNDNTDNCATYGRLYNYSTASGVCPSGWHLPSLTEWCTLAQYLDATTTCAHGYSGTDAGTKLKDSNGMNLLLGGWYQTSYSQLGNFGTYWTSTTYQTTPSVIHRFVIVSTGTQFGNSYDDDADLMSVRCLKD